MIVIFAGVVCAEPALLVLHQRQQQQQQQQLHLLAMTISTLLFLCVCQKILFVKIFCNCIVCNELVLNLLLFTLLVPFGLKIKLKIGKNQLVFRGFSMILANPQEKASKFSVTADTSANRIATRLVSNHLKVGRKTHWLVSI